MEKSPVSTSNYLEIRYPVEHRRCSVFDSDGAICEADTTDVAERIELALNACRSLTNEQLKDSLISEVISCACRNIAPKNEGV